MARRPAVPPRQHRLALLTLSLYRPFAAVNTARLRLEAVSLRLDGDLESWLGSADTLQQDAAGEAAGDFFGVDMGLLAASPPVCG